MSATTETKATSFSRTRRIAIVSIIVVVLVALDHLTKWLAITYLMGQPPIIYLGDLFRFQYATNTGAFLSLGSTLPDWLRPYLLTGLNGIILFVVSMFLIVKRDVTMPVTLSLSLILSGGIGNMIDRIFRNGEVVDFLNIGMPWGPFQIRSGIFNIADVAIMAGLFLMIGVELFLPSKSAVPGDAKVMEKDAG